MAKSEAQGKQAMDSKSFMEQVEDRISEIQKEYLADRRPWLVGYSGGKDSTATLALIWTAISRLPVEQRTKDIHVITTDTLVENPYVALWVAASHQKIGEAAKAQGMPVVPVMLTPDLSRQFFVLVIGRGYASPRMNMRFCTAGMKIDPANRYTAKLIAESGQAVMCLGVRSAESAARARSIKNMNPPDR
jgi:DNA sulfur modification protein DndC